MIHPVIQKIKELMEKESYFDCDNISNNCIEYDTRENGDPGSEEPGDKDIAEAKRICKMVTSRFPEVFADIDTIDEWVTIAFWVKNQYLC